MWWLPQVLYADPSGYIVFNKPAGHMVGHIVRRLGDCAAEFGAAALECLGTTAADNIAQHGIFCGNRLDIGTTGVWFAVTSPESRRYINQAIREHRPRKTYTAVVQGCLPASRGTIDVPLWTNGNLHPRSGRSITVVHSQGKPSITHYKVLATDGEASLVRVQIETGRTHQIRAHMQHVGCPVWGDSDYGYIGPVHPTCLHSTRTNLDGNTFKAPYPQHMQRWLQPEFYADTLSTPGKGESSATARGWRNSPIRALSR